MEQINPTTTNRYRTIPTHDPSLGELFRDLSEKTGLLLSQEVALAKAELRTSVSRMGESVGLLVAGGVIALLSAMAFMAAVISAMALIMPVWLASLIVSIVVGIIAAVLISKGRDSLSRVNLVPQQTVETLREDAEWVKEQVQ